MPVVLFPQLATLEKQLPVTWTIRISWVRGFLRAIDGTIASFELPTLSGTYLQSINPSGAITGFTGDTPYFDVALCSFCGRSGGDNAPYIRFFAHLCRRHNDVGGSLVIRSV